jgi:hypothetical protein
MPRLDKQEAAAALALTKLKGRAYACSGFFMLYSDAEGRWKKVSKKDFGFFLELKMRNINFSSRIASLIRSKLPRDDLFLTTTHASTGHKILFSDCVYDMKTGETCSTFNPEDRFAATVGKPFPVRIQNDVDKADRLFQDWLTPHNQTPAPRAADFDFDKMPLWQFEKLAIGLSIAGDCKHAFALVSPEGDSGTSTLEHAVMEAFDTELVAYKYTAPEELFESKTPRDYSKFLYPGICGARIFWCNEISKGTKCIDTTLMERLTSGHDLAMGKLDVHAKFTTFFNCNTLPPVRNHGNPDFLLKIVFPNVYVDSYYLSKPNMKLRN